MEGMKNLCAQIPDDLHARVREAQEQSGLSLGPYITKLLTEYFETRGHDTMETQRTMAFQIPEDLFQRLKVRLKKEGVSQKKYVLDILLRALDEADARETDGGEDPVEDTEENEAPDTAAETDGTDADSGGEAGDAEE